MRAFFFPFLLAGLVTPTSANDPSSGPSYRAAPRRAAADSLERALQDRRTWLNLNYRHEHITQEDFSRHANASTLRTVFGMETGNWGGVSAFLEVEDVTPIGAEHYNSTVNRNTAFPVVADPDGTEINQVYASLGGTDGVTVRIGRQEITLDNQRFVGNVGWRQNHQSFDSASLIFDSEDGTYFNYTYIDNVNRIFGDGHPLGDVRADAHLLNLSGSFEGLGKVTAYYYDVDLEDLPMLSSKTLGARLDASQEVSKGQEVLMVGEYAMQEATGGNRSSLDQDYYLASLGWKTQSFTFEVAREFMGGSGAIGDSFSTPLATLHGFNGYADIFLTTPFGGLIDDYVKLQTKLGALDTTIAFHEFHSDGGGALYGDEVDAAIVYPFSERTKIGMKFAYFDSKLSPFPHTTKLIAWLSFKVL